MKYKDYYQIMGLERSATQDEIKKAYRKLAHKYHPDVSKDKNAEERFKEVAEAYTTLKDPEKRAAYDRLGQHQAGEEFRPPPDWGAAGGPGGFGGGDFHFEDFGDLSDLFEQLGGRARGGRTRGAGRAGGFAMAGSDFEASVQISLEDAARGLEVSLDVSMPEMGADGALHRTPRTITVRIPKGASDGQRLRVRGKGAPGMGGGPPGDLYLDIHLAPHRLFRPTGHDLYLDLPITPAEAVLGAAIQLPTLQGTVELKVKPGAASGQKLRLSGRGLPTSTGGHGDLYAVVQIVVPAQASAREKELYAELAKDAHFNPRAHFDAKETP
jgi:curved DNA-binding protein